MLKEKKDGWMLDLILNIINAVPIILGPAELDCKYDLCFQPIVLQQHLIALEGPQFCINVGAILPHRGWSDEVHIPLLALLCSGPECHAQTHISGPGWILGPLAAFC